MRPAFAGFASRVTVAVPWEFLLFAATLLGVALFHRHTLPVALLGLGSIVAYKLAGPGFDAGPGAPGLAAHFAHEWVTLANLLGLLLGFAIIARYFEDSRVPLLLPNLLPDNWTGAFALLVTVFVVSAFLDNIAAALIGGAVAHTVFRGRVHIGYLAAIVAASNAGGSGSVVGDTTTTMMWISGVAPADVLRAYVGAGVALAIFGVPAARAQQRYAPIMKHAPADTHVDVARIAVVVWVLACAIVTNVTVSTRFGNVAEVFPVLGAAVLTACALGALVRVPDWRVLPGAFKGAAFLLALVSCASLMPVEQLPAASATTTFGLGVVSSVFDNIPLTALALRQGGYDWGALAYAVGFGGSMIWFGSSAGVALSSQYPEARSVRLWLRHGWFVAVAYAAGYGALIAALGWRP
jgi:Na+/H+ antiporter NhaD/arsenite permease-like protein